MRLINTGLGVVTMAMFLISIDAWAQAMPRRDRGGSPRERPPQSSEERKPVTPLDPFSALERELPSLEADLKLSAEQQEAWRLFARDVRDLAEMDRTRRKHMMSLREMGERPPNALTFVTTLVEDQRVRAEASQDLKMHLEALYSKASDDQKRMIDRRVMQSQTEPLGR